MNQPPPPLRLTNARIWTADTARPWADELCIADGRVVTSCGAARTIDCGGRVVIPGMIDAHTHLLMGGRTLDQLDLSKVNGRESFEEAIAREHARLGPNEWLIANGWSNEAWDDPTLPDHTWLEVAGDRPVVCYRVDIHAVLVNRVVLGMLDRSKGSAGGRIVRDSWGEPTGLLLEGAAWNLVNPIVPPASVEARRAHLRLAQQRHHEVGVTAVGSMEYRRDVEAVYVPSRTELTLRCAITLLDREWPLDVSYGVSFANDDHLSVVGYKAFLDGTLGSRTARLLAEYYDNPGNTGEFVEFALDDRLEAWAHRVADAGLSPSMHAIGDAAVRRALDVVDSIGRECRPRIEHAQHVQPDDMARFDGVFASMQPLHKADDARYAESRLGRERMNTFFPFRSLREAGAILAFGSDWPVVSYDPREGIRTAVTGLSADGIPIRVAESLTVEQALLAYTRDAARCLGMNEAGVLRPGALADCVVFERDPFTLDWRGRSPGILMTLGGGRIVYDARKESA